MTMLTTVNLGTYYAATQPVGGGLCSVYAGPDAEHLSWIGLAEWTGALFVAPPPVFASIAVDASTLAILNGAL